MNGLSRGVATTKKMGILDIFKCSGWGEVEDLVRIYEEVELVKPIGKWPAGSKFDACVFHVENLTMAFMDGDDVLLTVNLGVI